jgi:hypothetical protein
VLSGMILTWSGKVGFYILYQVAGNLRLRTKNTAQSLNTITFLQIKRNLTLVETECKFDNEFNKSLMPGFIE